MYPYGDLSKTKEERDFRVNTPIRENQIFKPEFRRDDVYARVKGVPRIPFIPTNIPIKGDSSDDEEEEDNNKLQNNTDQAIQPQIVGGAHEWISD